MKILAVEQDPFFILPYRSSGRGGVVRRVNLPFFRVTVDDLPDGMRSLVVTSDLQGREQDQTRNRLVGEAVVDALKQLEAGKQILPVDLVLLAGDLYDYPDCRKMGGTGDVTAVWNRFAQAYPSVVGVHGNHDIVQADQLASNTTVLDGDVIEQNGLRIGGVSGIIGRPDKNQRRTDVEFQRVLRQVIQQKPQILLLHQGPDNPPVEEKGDPEIRALLARKGEGIVAFGHCHWQQPYVLMGRHQVLNVDNRLFLFCPA